jgi:putative ABC transport system substrate-binding protein
MIGPHAVLTAALTYTLLVVPLATCQDTAEAQLATDTRRIGVFAPGSASGTDQFQQLLKAFREGLRDVGWVEGQNVVIETRWGEGRLDEFPRIVSQLVELSVDVLVTWGPQGVRAAQQATATVPIVMAIVHEPVAFGFVKSFARPGGCHECAVSHSCGILVAVARPGCGPPRRPRRSSA